MPSNQARMIKQSFDVLLHLLETHRKSCKLNGTNSSNAFPLIQVHTKTGILVKTTHLIKIQCVFIITNLLEI